MGTINDKLTFVYSYDTKSLRQLRQVVRSKLQRKDKEYVNLITPVMEYVRNGKACFIIIPDGSKIGWDTHEDIKEIRKNLHAQVENINRQLGSNSITILTLNMREDGKILEMISSEEFDWRL